MHEIIKTLLLQLNMNLEISKHMIKTDNMTCVPS